MIYFQFRVPPTPKWIINETTKCFFEREWLMILCQIFRQKLTPPNATAFAVGRRGIMKTRLITRSVFFSPRSFARFTEVKIFLNRVEKKKKKKKKAVPRFYQSSKGIVELFIEPWHAAGTSVAVSKVVVTAVAGRRRRQRTRAIYRPARFYWLLQRSEKPSRAIALPAAYRSTR